MSANLLTIDQVADELGVHRNTVTRWTNSTGKNRLPCVRRGKRFVRVKRTDLDAFLSTDTKKGGK